MSEIPNLGPDPAIELVNRAYRILRSVGAFGPRVDPAIFAAAAGANGLRSVWRMSHESYEDLASSDELGIRDGAGPVQAVPYPDRREVVVQLFGIEVEPVRRDVPHVGRPDGSTGPAWDHADLLELVISEARR